MAFLDPVLNPVLLPFLQASPLWGIVALALFLSIVITLAYKYLTDQVVMKSLRDQQKEFQQRMKALRDNPSEMMKVQKEAMKANLDYFKQSWNWKVILATMLPVMLIFGWMAAHLANEPIYPDETYSISAVFVKGASGNAELVADTGTQILSPAKQPVTSEITWQLKSTQGEHTLTIKSGTIEQTKKVIIGKDLKLAEAVSAYQHSDIGQIKINYNKLKPLGEFSLFGWQPGWLGLYIIFSIIFSTALRKVLKVY